MDFEIEVIRLLTSEALRPDEREAIIRDGRIIEYESTGCGYFLTLSHAAIPRARTVCSRPMVTGHCDGEECGFVVFLENGELLLECHTWTEDGLSESFREKDVRIRSAPDVPPTPCETS